MRLDRWDAFIAGLAFAETMNGRFTHAAVFLALVVLGVLANWRDDRRTNAHGGKDG